MRQSPRLAARMPGLEHSEVLNVAFVTAFWQRRRQEPSGLAFRHVPEEFPGNPLLKDLDPFLFLVRIEPVSFLLKKAGERIWPPSPDAIFHIMF